MDLTIFETGSFILYLILIIVIGFISGRKGKNSTSHFFLANRRLPWFVIGFSLIASSISSEQFIGEVGWGYRYGMAVCSWEWLVWPAQGLLLFFFLPVYLKNKIFTIPQFLTIRFGRLAGSTFALVCIAQYLIINIPLVLYSGGFVMNNIFGINIHLAIWLLVIAAGSYTIFGGMSAVAWVDLMNGILIICGGLLVFILGLNAVEGGFAAVVGTGDRSHLILPADHPELPWTGILAVAFVTSGYYYSTNQFITQRCLGAKTEWDGKMGVILAAFLAIPLALSVTWPGMIAYALNPNLEHADTAYNFLITTLIPVGLRGFIYAVLIGAIMSSLDSLINSTSSLLTLDIYKAHIKKDATDHHLVKFAQLSGIFLLIFSAIWSPIVGKFESIFAYVQDCWALMLAPVMAVFLTAIFWKRMTKISAIFVLFLAFPMLLIVFLREFFGILTVINIFNLSAIIFLISVSIIIVISKFTEAPETKAVFTTLWRKEMLKLPEEELEKNYPLWKHIGFWFTLVVFCFTIIYAIFW